MTSFSGFGRSQMRGKAKSHILLLGCLAVGLSGPASAAHLIVKDAQRQPVEGARVLVFPGAPGSDVLSRNLPPLLSGRSGSDGVVKEALPALGDLLVLVDHPAYGPYLGSPFAGLVGQPGASVPVVLTDGGAVTGVVTGVLTESSTAFDPSRVIHEGEVCAHWQETLPNRSRRHEWQRCAALEEGGGFRLTGLGTATVRLETAVPGYLPEIRRVRPGDRVTLGLKRGKLVEGTVLSPSSEPVAGAKVEIREGGEALSAGDGTFAVAVASLPATLYFEAEGYAAMAVTLDDGAAAERIRIVLEPVARVRASIFAPGETSVEELALRIVRLEGAREAFELHRIQVDDGAWLHDLPGSGEYRLELAAPGFRRLRVPPFAAEKGTVTDLGLLTLSEGAGVRGLLLDARSGEGVEGALISARSTGTAALTGMLAGESAGAVSGVGGAFRLTGLDEGRVELRVEHEAFPTAQWFADLEADTVEDLGVLELRAGVEVGGIVADRQGRPRPGVVVRFLDPEAASLLPVAETSTRRDGTIIPVEIPPGEYRVRVSAERMLLDQVAEVPAAESHDLELVVGATAVSGLVTRQGDPEAGGFLSLVSAADPGLNTGKILITGADGRSDGIGMPTSTISTEVDEEGRFHLDEAPTGAVNVTYVGPTGDTVQRQIEIPDQPTFDLVLDVSGLFLAGLVVDEDGGEEVLAHLSLYDAAGRLVGESPTEQDGSFLLADLEPGVFQLEAVAEGFAVEHRTVEVCEGCEPIAIALRRSDVGSLRIRLVRSGGGPAFGVPTVLLNGSGRAVQAFPTDALGEQSFENLSDGEYFVVWSDPASGTGVSPPVEVRSGEETAFDGRLETGGLVELSCSEEACADQAVQDLKVFTNTGLEIAPYLSGATVGRRFSPDGRFVLGRLAAGSYKLFVGLPGRLVERGFEVARVPIQLTLP